MEIQYVRIHEKDVPFYRDALAILANKTLGSATYNEPWSEERLAFKLQCCFSEGIALLALNGSEVVGAIFGHSARVGQVSPDVAAEHLPFTFVGGGLFVSPNFQGKGIGFQLIRMRLSFFQARGFRYFYALTNTAGAHLKFYKKLNYQTGQVIRSPNYRNVKIEISGEISHILAAMDQIGKVPLTPFFDARKARQTA